MRKQIAETIALHRRMLDKFETDCSAAVEKITKAIISCFEKGGSVYICGNGGSAADAQHIAAELIGRFIVKRKSLPAVALSTDTAVITAVANDYKFENVFERQVEGLVKKGDLLWAISTSGNSLNVVNAAKLAKKKGAEIIAFTGIRKSKLEKIADLCLCAENGKTAVVQEMHQVAYHIICGLVESHFARKR